MSIRVSPRPGEPKRNVLMSDLDEAINQLNTLLYSVMRDKNAEKPIPPFVFIMFARLFGFSHGYAWYWARWGYFRNEQAPTIFRPKAELLLLCAPDFLLHKDQIAQKNSSHALTPALAFITSLRHVMHILAVDPILIDTGQHEPIYDKPRTYADVQNEIAKRLAIPLQEYSAHCKLGTKEFTIKATQLREADTEAVLLSRKQRIIAQTRGQYCTKRVHVVEEITARQVELLKPIKKERKTKQEAE